MEDGASIAVSYEDLLESKDDENNISNLITKTSALDINAKYSQLQSMLLTWLNDDIGIYVQKMSTYLSTGDTSAGDDAIVARDNTYGDFSTITANIISIGDSLDGVDMTDIKEWTPESYVDEQINGGT